MAHADDPGRDDDPIPNEVETALLLNWDDRLGDCPYEEEIARWTPEQRREAFRWANDTDAGGPLPEFLKTRGAS
jgi:hypothetical protein